MNKKARKIALAIILVLIVAWRIRLWVACYTLLARGQNEEALFVIVADPLINIEWFLIGLSPWNLNVFWGNTICLVIWLAFFLFFSWAILSIPPIGKRKL
jgi:hypothetical protein